MTKSNKTWQKCILLVWINVGLGNKKTFKKDSSLQDIKFYYLGSGEIKRKR